MGLAGRFGGVRSRALGIHFFNLGCFSLAGCIGFVVAIVVTIVIADVRVPILDTTRKRNKRS